MSVMLSEENGRLTGFFTVPVMMMTAQQQSSAWSQRQGMA
jgi:hypothetical protein